MNYAQLWNRHQFQLDTKYVREWTGGHVHHVDLYVRGDFARIEFLWDTRESPDPQDVVEILANDLRIARRIKDEEDLRNSGIRYRSIQEFYRFIEDLYEALPEDFLTDLSRVTPRKGWVPG